MKRRSCGICNLKAFLLFCVVLGHALERDIDYDIAAANIYRVRYLRTLCKTLSTVRY